MGAISFDHLLNVVVFARFLLPLAHEAAEDADAVLGAELAAQVRGSECSRACVVMRLPLLHLAELVRLFRSAQ